MTVLAPELAEDLRPQLSPQEAEHYSKYNTLRYNGWAGNLTDNPWEPDTARDYDRPADVFVDPANADGETIFATLQDAIDHVVDTAAHTGAAHYVIGLVPGSHLGPAILPSFSGSETTPSITIKGLGNSPSDTVLSAPIDAEMPGAEYAKRYEKVFANSGLDVSALYRQIVQRTTISTGNAAVLRILADATRVRNLTIHNTYNADRGGTSGPDAVVNAHGQVSRGQHQAVALMVDGADKVAMDTLRLRSFQDTLYLKSPAHDIAVRSCLTDCEIEGDVDFIFGQATAYFQGCTIRSLGARGARSWVTAPSTNLRIPYGFVFNDCDFVHDNSPLAREGCFSLGRQWFEGVRASPYGTSQTPGYRCNISDQNAYHPPYGQITQATLEAVGKCVILRSRIAGHINVNAPWDDWNGPGYGADGRPLDGPWNPRYRPVQMHAAQFLGHARRWLGWDYCDVDPAARFLAEFENQITAHNSTQ